MSAITPPRLQPESRFTLACFGLIALVGIVAGWGQGNLPQRGPRPAIAQTNCTTPDLALYQAVISDVRQGRDYYDAAHERIPQFGFPISSPLNWRLPTYAWLLSLLPNKCWIQGVLLLLGIAGLWLTFAAERFKLDVFQAAFTTLLMFGVFRWVLDGDAYLAQEVWAGVLIMISVAALRLGESSWKWRALAALAGIAALLFRELALPYCLVAAGLALWQRRYWEAALWGKGLVGFSLLLAWHVLSRGTRASTPVSMPDVFVPACITPGTTGLIVVHNHPSGDPTPSQDDARLTVRLCQAADVLDIGLLDHLIVGDAGRYFSFRENHALKPVTW